MGKIEIILYIFKITVVQSKSMYTVKNKESYIILMDSSSILKPDDWYTTTVIIE